MPLGQMQSFSASLTDSLYELVRLRYGEHRCRRARLTNRMLTRTELHPHETVVVRRGGGEIEFFVLLHVAMELPTLEIVHRTRHRHKRYCDLRTPWQSIHSIGVEHATKTIVDLCDKSSVLDAMFRVWRKIDWQIRTPAFT